MPTALAPSSAVSESVCNAGQMVRLEGTDVTAL